MPGKQAKKLNHDLQTRPPVVVIMGHVDHGKTSILDFIRKSKIAEKESGGITQHIGAYQVEHQDKKITFIDTPGHEAFYAMRSRGAKVADIAILVVAADDGIMPQTKEAIKHIKHADIPMIIAINKIDKSNADVARVKNQLLEQEIVIEELKGKVPSVEVSANTGQGIDSLLEIISLVAEVEELKADESSKAKGVVIEAELNHKRGPIATLIVKKGVLKVGHVISFASTYGKIKGMEDFQGGQIKKAGPGTPVIVVGMGEVPLVGEKFKVVSSIEEAKKIVEGGLNKYSEEREVIETGDGIKMLNIVLKADVKGTLEAVREVLRGIGNENISLRILSQSVGDIMESDIKLASAANALIVGFRTKINPSAEGFARQMKVEVVLNDIIYELVEGVRVKINEFLSEEVEEVELGEVKVLAIFRTEKSKMIVGGKVIDGEVNRNAKFRVMRGEELLGEGKVGQIKIKDKVVEKVEKNQECGVLFEGPVRIQVGDILQAYEIRKRRL